MKIETADLGTYSIKSSKNSVFESSENKSVTQVNDILSASDYQMKVRIIQEDCPG